jgi:hypothetical protein
MGLPRDSVARQHVSTTATGPPLSRRSPVVLKESFASGGEDQECDPSWGASAELSIFPPQGSG